MVAMAVISSPFMLASLSTVSLGHYLVSMMAWLFLIIGFLVACSIYLKKHPALLQRLGGKIDAGQGAGAGQFPRTSTHLKVESRLELEARKTLYVVSFGEEQFLVATSGETTQLLSSLKAQTGQREALPSAEEKLPSFGAYLNSVHAGSPIPETATPIVTRTFSEIRPETLPETVAETLSETVSEIIADYDPDIYELAAPAHPAIASSTASPLENIERPLRQKSLFATTVRLPKTDAKASATPGAIPYTNAGSTLFRSALQLLSSIGKKMETLLNTAVNVSERAASMQTPSRLSNYRPISASRSSLKPDSPEPVLPDTRAFPSDESAPKAIKRVPSQASYSVSSAER
jgi:flagellar biogenesis protein FliO